MKLSKQLPLFVENQPGSLNAVCQVLKDHQINIRTLSLADTQQFGILRLLVKEHEKARAALEAAGFIVKSTDVLALPVSDRPGGLADILNVLDRNQMSVEYMYAFTFGRSESAVMVFRFEEPEKALQVLTEAGVPAVSEIELFA